MMTKVTSKSRLMGLKVLSVGALAFMLLLNILANILPLNGVGTGAVSDFYFNLFAPAGYTFAIWGLIYLLLIGFAVGLFTLHKEELVGRVAPWFIVSSLANGFWILAWHYYLPLVSLVLILLMLGSLARICLILSREDLSGGSFWLLKLPFGVYFGWVTVAVIANVTAFLVSLEQEGLLDLGFLAPEVWTVVVLLAGLLIGLAVLVRLRDPAYGLVLGWSYLGILVRHVLPSGFGGMFPLVVVVSGVGVGLFLLVSLMVKLGWRVPFRFL